MNSDAVLACIALAIILLALYSWNAGIAYVCNTPPRGVPFEFTDFILGGCMNATIKPVYPADNLTRESCVAACGKAHFPINYFQDSPKVCLCLETHRCTGFVPAP